jgi:hypothetical protein
LIEDHFSPRQPPSTITDSLQLTDVEYEEVTHFEGMDWHDIEFWQAESRADAIFWFSPQAFCYYLPGFLAAGLKSNRADSNAYDAIINMLDRSPEPAHWDEFFQPRWTLFSDLEIVAIEAWVRWFAKLYPDAFYANTYERVFDTLDLLRMYER